MGVWSVVTIHARALARIRAWVPVTLPACSHAKVAARTLAMWGVVELVKVGVKKGVRLDAKPHAKAVVKAVAPEVAQRGAQLLVRGLALVDALVVREHVKGLALESVLVVQDHVRVLALVRADGDAAIALDHVQEHVWGLVWVPVPTLVCLE